MENDTVENKNDNTFKKFLDDITDIVESVIFSVFIVLLIFTYLFRISDVSGPSMLPTLHNDDRVVISSLFYTPKPNDIVIVNSSALKKLIVKRVIGMSGQSVDIDFEKGTVSVDGVPVDEQLYVENPDGSEPALDADHFVNTLTTINMGAFDEYPITVPQGYVFVLGDNRNQSKDSKHAELGFVPEDEIVGKVIYRVFPFDKLGTVN